MSVRKQLLHMQGMISDCPNLTNFSKFFEVLQKRESADVGDHFQCI